MQRNTPQRKIILDAVIKLNTHPTIEEVYGEIQREYPSISKTTVYRNLRHLAGEGMLREVSLLDGLERYDVRTDKHYHFRCKQCDGAFDIDLEHMEGINDVIQKRYGFQVEGHNLLFTGVCQSCVSGGGQEKNL
ncbi:MAG: transcriptional repressor [Treponema sp.]|nr:transcriptional repressor [Treponema sp.]